MHEKLKKSIKNREGFEKTLSILHSKEFKELSETIRNFIEENPNFSEEYTKLIESNPEYEDMEIHEVLELLKNSTDKNENLKVQNIKYLSKFFIPKDRVTNKFFKNEIPIGVEQPVRTNGVSSKKQLIALVTIDYENLKDISISRDLDYYDWHVFNAVVSLSLENKAIKMSTIYKAITGNKEAKLTQKPKQELKKSLEKMALTRIHINAKDEATAYKMKDIVFTGYLLPINYLTNGEDEWVKILETPMLYKYASQKKQVACVDMNVINTPLKKFRADFELQAYLLSLINEMKGNSPNRIINYNNLYEKLNISAASESSLRNEKQKIREKTEKLLNYWKKINFIKDFKRNPGANKTIKSITIDF